MTDNVNHPSHYQTESGLEAIDVIEAFFHNNAYLANVFKYIARAGKKGSKLEDLKKAKVYLEREIALTERYREDALPTLTPRGPGALYINGVPAQEYWSILASTPKREPRQWGTLDEIPIIGVSRVVDKEGDYYDALEDGGWSFYRTGSAIYDYEDWAEYGPFTEVLDG